MIEEKLTDQEKARIDKLPRYRELGVDPFGSRYDWKDQIRDLRANYGELSAEELKEKAIKVNVAGRLMALRKMGKAAFGNIHDEYGSIQFWIGLQSVRELQGFQIVGFRRRCRIRRHFDEIPNRRAHHSRGALHPFVQMFEAFA